MEDCNDCKEKMKVFQRSQTNIDTNGIISLLYITKLFANLYLSLLNIRLIKINTITEE